MKKVKEFFEMFIAAFLIHLLLFSWLLLIGLLIQALSDTESAWHKIGVVLSWAPFVIAGIAALIIPVYNQKEFGSLDEYTEKMRDEEDYLSNAYFKMCKKCAYGEEIEKLTEKERVIFVTQELAMEVNNGGFHQFYANSSGNFANEVITALKTLGAEEMLAVCKKTNAVFGETVPTDRVERNAILEEKLTPEQLSFLEGCEDEFIDAYSELLELSYKYLIESEGDKTAE